MGRPEPPPDRPRPTRLLLAYIIYGLTFSGGIGVVVVDITSRKILADRLEDLAEHDELIIRGRVERPAPTPGKEAGIAVHYCAEQFENDGSMASGVMR